MPELSSLTVKKLWHFFEVTRQNAFREKGECMSVPTAQGKPCMSKASSKPKTTGYTFRRAIEERCLGSPIPGSRPHLLHPRCSCHSKDCACTDRWRQVHHRLGERVMPSPRATRSCTLQPYRTWAEQRRTLSPEDRERKGG